MLQMIVQMIIQMIIQIIYQNGYQSSLISCPKFSDCSKSIEDLDRGKVNARHIQIVVGLKKADSAP